MTLLNTLARVLGLHEEAARAERTVTPLTAEELKSVVGAGPNGGWSDAAATATTPEGGPNGGWDL